MALEAAPTLSRTIEPAVVSIRLWSCPIIALLAGGCSAIGWELPNYGFYSFAPRADPRQMEPGTVLEVVRRVVPGDTTDLHEGDLRLDTTTVGGEQAWVISRRTIDAQQRPIVDSAWLDRWTLRTMATARSGPEGITRQRFYRRSVNAEFIPAGDNRVRRQKMLYEAEPYGEVGIDLVVAALQMKVGGGGKLPIVPDYGKDLYWLEYSILDRRMEPVPRAGGIVYQSVWLIDLVGRGMKTRLWVDDESRSVIRREQMLSPTEKLLVTRGPKIPAVQLFPTERLASGALEPRTIRRGSMLQVTPLPLPGESAAVPPVRPTPPNGGQ